MIRYPSWLPGRGLRPLGRFLVRIPRHFHRSWFWAVAAAGVVAYMLCRPLPDPGVFLGLPSGVSGALAWPLERLIHPLSHLHFWEILGPALLSGITTAGLVYFARKTWSAEKRRLREEERQLRSAFPVFKAERFDPYQIVGGYDAAGCTDYLPITADFDLESALGRGRDI